MPVFICICVSSQTFGASDTVNLNIVRNVSNEISANIPFDLLKRKYFSCILSLSHSTVF